MCPYPLPLKPVPSTKVGFLEGTVGIRVRNKGYLCHSLPLSDDSSESEGANAGRRPEMDDARNGRGGRGNGALERFRCGSHVVVRSLQLDGLHQIQAPVYIAAVN